MEKNRIVPLVYGYIVCLVSIIVTLISISMLIGAIFGLQDPLRAPDPRYGNTVNLSSYEAYRVDILTGRGATGAETKTITGYTYEPTDTELQSAYSTAKDDHIAAVKLEAYRTITNAILLLAAAGILFFTHWRWVTRFNRHE